MIVFSFQEVSNISGYFENVVFPLDSSVPPSQFSADVSESSSSSELLLQPSDSDSSVRPQRCSTPRRSSAFKPSSSSSDSRVSQRSTSSAEKKPKTTHSDPAPSSQKKKWSDKEVAAVESQMGRFITKGTTPGKEQCEECIRRSPEALKNRDWRAVKYYVRNRIVSLTRKT
ncbi:uncharacterized protein LOC115543093 isoform X1 [Gadus morhua]|uniref:uncharacterized protein LOC115543093 isoform X1 n=1 Tax=Gadus morhua TaxID=8049 RepID=UPI0011B62A17|nr:uncharacterized protein LOC115543093 isoform X1 [Gadus morhua]